MIYLLIKISKNYSFKKFNKIQELALIQSVSKKDNKKDKKEIKEKVKVVKKKEKKIIKDNKL